MFKALKRRQKERRKAEMLKRKRDEQLKKEIEELQIKVKFEQECG